MSTGNGPQGAPASHTTAAAEPGLSASPVTAGPASSAPRARWPLAVALSLALSLLWWLPTWWSDRPGPDWLLYYWGPSAAAAILVYLDLARAPLAPWSPARLVTAGLVLAAFTLHAWTFSPLAQPGMALLAWIHLPALAWVVLGAAVLRARPGRADMFAALVKSIEVLVAAALCGGAAAVFAGVTLGLFQALGVHLPERVILWLATGLPGLVPVLAVASIYDPVLPPSAQRLGQGLTRLFFIVARAFLPLTLLVLVACALVIPSHFRGPFENRGTLIAFDAMLFAVMLLLVCATPFDEDELPPVLARWLRSGIVAVAALALLISLYALAAVLWRTSRGGLTANRLTVIGWNVANLGVLARLLASQVRAGRGRWVTALHGTFAGGILLYALWIVFVVVALPLLARWAGWAAPPTPDLGFD